MGQTGEGVYVVDFEPGLYGPFATREAADEWAGRHVSATGDPGITYGWLVQRVTAPGDALHLPGK